jgi:hypothetical protein
MINTLSLEQAIEKCPALVATKPSDRASSKYSFIRTVDILEKAVDSGWVIQDVRQAGPRETAQHSVTLFHSSQLEEGISQKEGYPQMRIINSHDLTKRFNYLLGYWKLACSNGLLVPNGICSSINSVHRFSDDMKVQLEIAMNAALENFGKITGAIETFKQRILSQEEKNMLARFAHYIRFRYRMTQPKKFNTNELLAPRRDVDKSDDLWSVFNVIQENMTHGGAGIGKGITRFQDDIRFNQELWMGVSKAVDHRGMNLNKTLKDLFQKKERNSSN